MSAAFTDWYRVKLRHPKHGDYESKANTGSWQSAGEIVKRSAAAIYATKPDEWSVVTVSEIEEESARG